VHNAIIRYRRNCAGGEGLLIAPKMISAVQMLCLNHWVISPWQRLLLLLLHRLWHLPLHPLPLRLRAAFAVVAPVSFAAATSAAVSTVPTLCISSCGFHQLSPHFYCTYCNTNTSNPPAALL
jgi:hypothetical protein